MKDDADRFADGTYDDSTPPTVDAVEFNPTVDELAAALTEARRTLAKTDEFKRVQGLEKRLESSSLDKDAPELGTFFDDAMGFMIRRATGEAKPVPLPDDWKALAEALDGGFWGGTMTVVVGSTGCGKTQWTLQASLNAAMAGVPVLYVGLELGRPQLVARLAALLDTERRVQWADLFLGRRRGVVGEGLLGDEARTVLEEAGRFLRHLPIRLEVGGPLGWDYRTLFRRAKAMRAAYESAGKLDEGAPFLVVLDFLQLVASPKGVRQDLRERIAAAAYAARQVARDLNAAVVLVSSMSRENAKAVAALADGDKFGDNPDELVGVGKESGEIEYAADALVVMAKKPWKERGDDGKRKPPAGGTAVLFATPKKRTGRGDTVELRFNGTRFGAPPAPVSLEGKVL